jgi:hypothetical protein
LTSEINARKEKIYIIPVGTGVFLLVWFGGLLIWVWWVAWLMDSGLRTQWGCIRPQWAECFTVSTPFLAYLYTAYGLLLAKE